MQSRLAAAIASKSTGWAFSSRALRRGLGTSTPYRTADPAGHAEDYQAHQPAVPHGMPDESQEHREPETAKPQRTDNDDDQQRNYNYKKSTNPTEPLSPPKPPYPSSPRLESTGVNHPVDPTLQQKRSATNQAGSSLIDDVSCVGIDGSPWPREEEEKQRSIEEQQEEEREYYKHHKASPLSEIKMADTRKPITRATDGTADSYEDEYGRGRDVVGWLPEQLDTAEEALRRAAEIFKQNAMRVHLPDQSLFDYLV
ncbi:uncharacterized protein LOC21390860 [Morus notabilis]|uniref:uncharacterized protein LOC21390860 n=1 Tax=Morus notabilis TaxID=981085 RepID=UPI000CED39F8|nr:uncharacterized protein LOC21390860 [Morus notabilis]